MAPYWPAMTTAVHSNTPNGTHLQRNICRWAVDIIKLLLCFLLATYGNRSGVHIHPALALWNKVYNWKHNHCHVAIANMIEQYTVRRKLFTSFAMHINNVKSFILPLGGFGPYNFRKH